MSRTVRSIAVAAAIALTASLAACSPAAQTAQPNASAEPVYGGTLTFLESHPSYCYYAAGNNYYPTATIINQIADKLTYQDPETREITPWLATSWTVNDTATEYEFTLRDDVTFSDGSPLDAETVALNYDNFGLGDADRGIFPQETVSNYERSEVVDEHTVKFYFSAPTPGFLQATSIVNAPIVAKATAELSYDEQCQLDNIIGSGPFTVTDIVPDQKYTLAVRDDYDWAPEVSEHQGRAYLDQIDVVVTPEDNVRVGALTSGQADAIRTVQPYDVAGIEAAGGTVWFAPTNGANPNLGLRTGNPILADQTVREALLKATDTTALVDKVFLGQFTAATGVLSAGATGYVDQSTQLAYDPKQAQALLDEAGWTVGSDGIREKNGERLSLTTWTVSAFPLIQQTDEVIAEQWKKVGVELKIETPDQATMAAGWGDPLQVGVSITQAGRVDPDVLKALFHSTGSRKPLVPGDATLDALLETIASEPTQDARFAAAVDAQNYLIDNALIIPLYELSQTYATTAQTHGLGWEPVGRVQLYDTWVDKR